ncbi:MAG TPA: nitronate monooxygenase, partial [Candidatus Mediterraneibacter stercoravium]|nr:nitronate monooxygenase [Candidatus Mediterraneibacter stercoravium]
GEKYNVEIPVVVAGGIYDSTDVKRVLALGADGVQVATRFVTTEECDADIRYKEAYINATKEDIKIVKSPVGMPGRAIMNSFMERVMSGEKVPHSPCHRCLAKCDPANIPYCITDGLINAVKGNIENALLFCGAKAYRAEKIETVKDVVQALFA